LALKWIILLAVLPFWFLQNILHELAHGLTLWLGWRWKFSIWPFPSKKLGMWTFSHVVYSPTSDSTDPSNKGWGLVSGAPALMNLVFLLTGSALATCLWPTYIIAPFCAMFAFFNLIDFTVNAASIFRREPNQSDIWRVQSYTKTDTYTLRWTVALSLLLSWFLMAIPAYLFWMVKPW